MDVKNPSKKNDSVYITDCDSDTNELNINTPSNNNINSSVPFYRNK